MPQHVTIILSVSSLSGTLIHRDHGVDLLLLWGGCCCHLVAEGQSHCSRTIPSKSPRSKLNSPKTEERGQDTSKEVFAFSFPLKHIT